ncbi:MAG: anthrone oxygenase family protein [Acidobacteriota bacterium]
MGKLGLATYALMVSIVLWGILLGGGIYSMMVYFPAYLSHLPESAVVVTGPYGLNEGSFWLSIHPLVILSFIVSLTLNWRNRGRRRLIGTVFVVYALILVVTQAYFLPELSAFRQSAQSGISNIEWQQRTGRWQLLNAVRAVVILANFVMLLLALARPGTTKQLLFDA